MGLPYVKITDLEPNNFSLTIDGVEVPEVRSYSVSRRYDGIGVLKLELLVREVEITTDQSDLDVEVTDITTLYDEAYKYAPTATKKVGI